MLIKFTKTDPRAGQVVRMDSTRGQELVDSGAAVKVKEGGSEVDTATAAPAPATDAGGDAAPAITETVPTKPARVSKK